MYKQTCGCVWAMHVCVSCGLPSTREMSLNQPQPCPRRRPRPHRRRSEHPCPKTHTSRASRTTTYTTPSSFAGVVPKVNLPLTTHRFPLLLLLFPTPSSSVHTASPAPRRSTFEHSPKSDVGVARLSMQSAQQLGLRRESAPNGAHHAPASEEGVPQSVAQPSCRPCCVHCFNTRATPARTICALTHARVRGYSHTIQTLYRSQLTQLVHFEVNNNPPHTNTLKPHPRPPARTHA
jgi:hypothetical protein